MISRARKLTPTVLAVLAALLMGACGSSHTRVTTGTYAGESGASAPYLNVGQLIYQIQLSRQLNPFDTEDAAYLQGLPALKLPPGEEWLGVFLQVYNTHSNPMQAATDITIFDTQGNVYKPVEPAQTNQFAYRGGVVPGKERLPVPASVAAQGATQGALLLYRISFASLDNRPMKVRIVNPQNPSEAATAELDI